MCVGFRGAASRFVAQIAALIAGPPLRSVHLEQDLCVTTLLVVYTTGNFSPFRLKNVFRNIVYCVFFLDVLWYYLLKGLVI